MRMNSGASHEARRADQDSLCAFHEIRAKLKATLNKSILDVFSGREPEVNSDSLPPNQSLARLMTQHCVPRPSGRLRRSACGSRERHIPVPRQR
jgi:hypothetical protein